MTVGFCPLLALSFIAWTGSKGGLTDIFRCMIEVEYLDGGMRLKKFPIALGAIGMSNICSIRVQILDVRNLSLHTLIEGCFAVFGGRTNVNGVLSFACTVVKCHCASHRFPVALLTQEHTSTVRSDGYRRHRLIELWCLIVPVFFLGLRHATHRLRKVLQKRPGTISPMILQKISPDRCRRTDGILMRHYFRKARGRRDDDACITLKWTKCLSPARPLVEMPEYFDLTVWSLVKLRQLALGR